MKMTSYFDPCEYFLTKICPVLVQISPCGAKIGFSCAVGVILGQNMTKIKRNVCLLAHDGRKISMEK